MYKWEENKANGRAEKEKGCVEIKRIERIEKYSRQRKIVERRKERGKRVEKILK